MAGRRDWYNISTFVCPECSTEMPIPRWHGHRREKGHIKDLYCPVCKTERKFKEYTYKQFYRTLDGDEISV